MQQRLKRRPIRASGLRPDPSFSTIGVELSSSRDHVGASKSRSIGLQPVWAAWARPLPAFRAGARAALARSG